MPRNVNARWFLGLISPWAWVLLAPWGLRQEKEVFAIIAPYAIFLCLGALAMAALLSWYHDYSGLLCIALALGLSVWSLERLPQGDTAILATVFLLPLNFAVFAWWRERGVVTSSGLLKLALVGAQAGGVAALIGKVGGRFDGFLSYGAREGAWSWMPWAAQLSFVVAALMLLALVLLRRTKVEPGLLWALVAVFLGFGWEGTGAFLLYTAAAGLILALAVLEQGFDLAYRDELTGLPGRRAFNQLLQRLGRNYAIAMCDVDHFKNFNDTYGHDAGDQLLKMIASKLSAVRGGGLAYRLGGEEFAVVFRRLSAREAQAMLESLRQGISGTHFVLRGSDGRKRRQLGDDAEDGVKITISIGVAQQSPRHSTPELVLDAADAALYRAKEAGRNRVMLADGTPA